MEVFPQRMLRRLKAQSDHLERMFETRSDAWEKVGLAMQTSQRTVRRARREAGVLLPVLIGVLVVYADRNSIFGLHGKHNPWQTPIRIITVIALVIVGWALARDIGRAAAPTFFRRMDPATAGTVGFLMRLGTVGITLLIALAVAGANPGTLVAGGAFTAVVVGLAAQQTLGNLIAGLVLLSARPFRVGERVRLYAGAIGGAHEGVVSSLGLLYTTFARGDDQIMIPNNAVLSAAIVPLREPPAVDVRVRLTSGVRPSHVQVLLDDRISTPTRSAATVVLEELDGEEVVVRVQATPERAADGAKLADEIIETLASVTGEHDLGGERDASGERARKDAGDAAAQRDPASQPDGNGNPAAPGAPAVPGSTAAAGEAAAVAATDPTVAGE